MARYFKMQEISENEFLDKVGETLGGCSQFTAPLDDAMYIAADEHEREIESIEIAPFNKMKREDDDSLLKKTFNMLCDYNISSPAGCDNCPYVEFVEDKRCFEAYKDDVCGSIGGETNG